ncbi:MAG TPA: DEAD/DEAH box helicase family protein, partial [Alphaproteobacteria bacterium]|nr:DEAD/DEAH box helicase family protein [Alphaproteobacteria bacterium]
MPNGLASSDPARDPDFPSGPPESQRIRVLLPLALPGALDYRAAPGPGLRPGAFVRVPLGTRERIGVVWDAEVEAGDGPAEGRLKDVLEVLDAPPMGAVMRRFIDWVAAYTLSPPGAVLKMAMSVPKALTPETPVAAYLATTDWRAPDGFRMTPQRQKVLDLTASGPPRTMADIRNETGAGSTVVKGLAEAGALTVHAEAPPSPFGIPDPERAGPALTPAQSEAAEQLRAALSAEEFSVTLLDGVTGSGKTEVYFEAIAETLRQGRQALVLL